MKIEHVALLTNDLEKMRDFYETYFAAKSSVLYHNPKTKFSSYFLSFESGARLELMQKLHTAPHGFEQLGYHHLAISLGSKEKVDAFAQKLNADGYPLLSGPRTTGDGYYEAVLQDPEGNQIEIAV